MRSPNINLAFKCEAADSADLASFSERTSTQRRQVSRTELDSLAGAACWYADRQTRHWQLKKREFLFGLIHPFRFSRGSPQSSSRRFRTARKRLSCPSA